MNWETDKSIYEHFSNLKENSGFVKKIAEIRKNAGLPHRGLNKVESNDKYPETPLYLVEADLSQASIEVIKEGVNDIIKKFRLGPHLREIVEGYIVQGDKYIQRMGLSDIKETIGCSLDYDRESSILRIYPEATKNRVITFLKENWDDIEHQQMHIAYGELSEVEKAQNGSKADANQGRFHINVKTKPKRHRDKEIMNLHEWGVLTSVGTFDDEKARVFLSDMGVQENELTDIPVCFRKLGYDLPQQDAIKKVIQRLNKARKG